MSHFSVLILTDDIDNVDELLAPFDENITVPKYISQTKTQIIESGKIKKNNILTRMQNDPNFDIKDFHKKYLDATTDEEFYKLETYDDYDYDEDGNLLSTYNPKSKWDWYSIGGRWSGLIKTKDGEEVDYAPLSEIDFSMDKEEYDKAIRYWEVVVEDQPLKTNEDKDKFRSFYNKEYFLERYKTKENYAKFSASFSTFAVVTPDGEWHEQGEMGWFGMDNCSGDDVVNWHLNYKKEFIDSCPEDMIAVVVDCHI